MLRIVQAGTSIAGSFILDPSPEFQGGMIAELTTVGNQIVATVSKGIAPLGVIDDMRTKSFTAVSWNEVIIEPITGVIGPGNVLVSPIDIKTELKNPNILATTFTSTVDVRLNPRNGVITFLAGTPLNFDLTGGGTPNAIRTIVNYTYQIPNVPGDDSTLGSGRVTVWYDRFFGQTDQFETNVGYGLNSMLYCNEFGMLTSRKPGEGYPAVAMCTSPPTVSTGMLEFMWL